MKLSKKIRVSCLLVNKERRAKTDEIEELLKNAEEEVLQASDKIIALTVNFGSDNWLSELIAICNVRRQQIAIYRNRVRFLKRIIMLSQVTREAKVLLAQVKELAKECQKLKQLASELA